MTRETKVGMVVACSFLCLVGVVVASKLRGANAPSADGEQQEIKVAAAKANPEPEKKIVPPAPAKSAKDAVVISPTPAKDEKKAADTFTPIGSGGVGDFRFEIPPQQKQPEPAKSPIETELARQRDQALAQNTPLPVPAPVAAPPLEKKEGGFNFPPIENKGPTPIGAAPIEPKGNGFSFPPIENKGPTPIGAAPTEPKNNGFSFPPIENKGPTPIGPAPIEPKGNGIAFPPTENKGPAPIEPKGNGFSFPPIENKNPTPIGAAPIEPKGNGFSFPPIENKGPTPITATPIEKKDGTAIPPLDKKDGGGVTFPPIGRKDGPPAVQPPNALDPKITAPNPFVIGGEKNPGGIGQIGGVQPIPAAPLEEKKNGPVFPPITNKPDNTQPIGDPGKKPFTVEPPPTVQPFVDKNPIPMISAPKGPGNVTSEPIPSAPPFNPTPKGPNPTIPNGQTNPFEMPSTPPIGTASVNIGGKPVVKETLPDSHIARTGETNFNALSASIYGDPRYANALLAYNRRYRTIIRNGEYLALDPPTVREGQEVLYPNRGILERDFGNLIPGLTMTGGNPTIPIGNNSGINIAKPAPITTPNISAVSNPPSGPSGRVYVVQNPNGESILDIAERALGSRSRWNDIYQLNAGVQPQFRIPAGTQLKLP